MKKRGERKKYKCVSVVVLIGMCVSISVLDVHACVWVCMYEFECSLGEKEQDESDSCV